MRARTGFLAVALLPCVILVGAQALSGSNIRQFDPVQARASGGSGARSEECARVVIVVRPDGQGDVPTIQDAVAIAQNGDIIELTNGTFADTGNVDVDYLGKAITIRSQSANPESCVVDCWNLKRGFIFQSGEPATAVLEGVKIINGSANYGGAVYVSYDANPTIRHCVFYQNHASIVGGGVYLDNTGNLENCDFIQNEAYSGGGVDCEGPASLSDCTFTDNSASDYFGMGGGLYCSAIPGNGPLLERCVFTGNFGDRGGAIGAGGGEKRDRPTPETATEGRGGRGPALATFRECLFDANDAGDGGAVYLDDVALLESCTFLNNTAGDGGALYNNASPGTLALRNCTFNGNSSPGDGAIYAAAHSETQVERSIITFGAAGASVYCGTNASITMSCCDIYGNAGGDWVGCVADQLGVNGNISADPLYWNAPGGDFRLRSDSPCAPGNNGDCGLMGSQIPYSYFVDPDPGGGDYITISEAIEDVPDFVTVVLADTTFSGPGNVDVDLLGKPITITSESGDPNLCIIDCGGSPSTPHRAFWFHTSEGANTVIRSIKIVNGFAATTRSGGGGAILCDDGTSPRLDDLIMQDNGASAGGGGVHCGVNASPSITGCDIRGSYAEPVPPQRGGGRVANAGGGGVHCDAFSAAQIIGCIIGENSASAGGGGVHCEVNSAPTIRGCTIVRNASPDAGGIYCSEFSTVTVLNTIIAFSTEGPAVACEAGATANLTCCDVYGNAGGDWVGCIAGQFGSDGNIAANPFFCDLEQGDYFLADNSPCAMENNPGCGQIGALPLGGCGNAPYVVRADGTGAFATIQDAINALDAGDIIELAPGTFAGPGNRDLDYLGKALTIRSQGRDPESCIIDCEGSPSTPHRGFNFHSGEGPGSLLQGVKIVGGNASSPAPNNSGGAIRCDTGCSPTIIGCIMAGNVAGADGGALYCRQSAMEIASCRFENNQAGGRGGGIYCYFATPSLEGCTLEGNSAGSLGGGIYCELSTAFVQHSSLLGNSAPFGGAVYATLGTSAPEFTACTLAGNMASLSGGCLYADSSSHPVLDSCTLFGNLATNGGGILSSDLAAVTVHNTIVAFGVQGQAVHCTAGTVTLTCSDIYGNAGGDWDGCIAGQSGINGNLAVDPELCHPEVGDFHLMETSACAAENNPGCGQIGAWPAGCLPVMVTEPARLPTEARLYPCYPNPFNPVTCLRFDLPADGRALLSIHDLAGRLVRTLLDGDLPAGSHATLWDGRNARGQLVASGVYFGRLQMGNLVQTQRMLLLK